VVQARQYVFVSCAAVHAITDIRDTRGGVGSVVRQAMCMMR
jgi:hypothetical protein